MNTTKVPSIVQIEERELRQLLNQVEETVATNVPEFQKPSRKRKFGVVDLWHCRKQSRMQGLIIR
jgi:hypothetical protein